VPTPPATPADQPGHAPVLVSVYGAGDTAFGGAEPVRRCRNGRAARLSAAADSVSGRAIVAYGILSPNVLQISSRPAS
jgi:hypothetical protein